MIRAKEFNKAYSKLFLLLILLNWRVKGINRKAIRSGFQNLEISSPVAISWIWPSGSLLAVRSLQSLNLWWVIFWILILGIFLGGVDFSSLSVSVGDAVFSCGNFIMAVINLMLVAFVWVILVRQVNRIKQATQKPQKKTHAVDLGPSENELLADILVVLQKK